MEEINKPKVKVLGKDGNVFSIMDRCTDALKKAGYKEDASILIDRVIRSGSYDEALKIMQESCEFI